jgi:hypothetical protein
MADKMVVRGGVQRPQPLLEPGQDRFVSVQAMERITV